MMSVIVVVMMMLVHDDDSDNGDDHHVDDDKDDDDDGDVDDSVHHDDRTIRTIPTYIHSYVLYNYPDTSRLLKTRLRTLSSLSFLDNVTDGMVEEEGTAEYVCAISLSLQCLMCLFL